MTNLTCVKQKIDTIKTVDELVSDYGKLNNMKILCHEDHDSATIDIHVKIGQLI